MFLPDRLVGGDVLKNATGGSIRARVEMPKGPHTP